VIDTFEYLFIIGAILGMEAIENYFHIATGTQFGTIWYPYKIGAASGIDEIYCLLNMGPAMLFTAFQCFFEMRTEIYHCNGDHGMAS
jgi:hypothetical protein